MIFLKTGRRKRRSVVPCQLFFPKMATVHRTFSTVRQYGKKGGAAEKGFRLPYYEGTKAIGGHAAGVTCVIVGKFCLHGQLRQDDPTIQVLDADTLELLCELKGHNSSVLRLAFVPGTTLLVLCSNDRTSKVLDVVDRTCIHTLAGHEHFVSLRARESPWQPNCFGQLRREHQAVESRHRPQRANHQ